MENGGNEKFNSFISQYGIPKETDIVAKYNTNAASVYRDRIQALSEGKSWRDPPVVKEASKPNNSHTSQNSHKSKPPLSGRNGNLGSDSGWDSWDSFDDSGSNNIRRNNSVGDFRSSGNGGGVPSRSKSTQDIYSRAQLEASAANKEDFFARKIAENDSKPDGVPPSQGGKYVGFGSSPASAAPRKNNADGDVLSVVSQGFGMLSLAAASAANVVQAGTKEITSKVREGGYEETVSVVTAKTSEIGQKTWGLMKGVMALASQKVEEFTKEGSGSQRNETDTSGYYQQFGNESKGWNSSAGAQSSSSRQSTSVSSASWDDWDTQDSRKEDSSKGAAPKNGDNSWTGWDDGKDDGYDSFYHSAPDKNSAGYNGKSDSNWTGGGFL